jgi:exosome complex component CSL4
MTTNLRFEIGSVVTPGDRLGSLRHVTPGVGTYARGGHVFSSTVGKLVVDEEEQKLVSVQSSKSPALDQVLSIGQLVLCRVVRLMLQQASVEIVAAAGCKQLLHKPEASIRREDVRQNATDELLLETCFCPGDWVLGRIVSLGDARRYLVSTSETELGVVRAVSRASSGTPMTPVSWKEMECPETGKKELRKVAKPSEALQQVLMGLPTTPITN